ASFFCVRALSPETRRGFARLPRPASTSDPSVYRAAARRCASERRGMRRGVLGKWRGRELHSARFVRPTSAKVEAGSPDLRRGGVRWSPGIRLASKPKAIRFSSVQVLRVRDVEGAEKAHLKAHFFRVIEAATESGDLALAVPKDSVALVIE